MKKIRMITDSTFMNVRFEKNVFSDTTCEIVQIISRLVHYSAKVLDATIIIKIRNAKRLSNIECAGTSLR